MKPTDALHRAAELGDLQSVVALADGEAVNRFDGAGLTPLMIAASSAQSGPEIVRALIDAGAAVNIGAVGEYDRGRTPLSFALAACDARKARLLLDAGADIHVSRDGGSVLIDAAYGATWRTQEELLPLLVLLIERGAKLDVVTRYGESALSVLSNSGHFEGVRCLLAAGARPTPLKWSALHRAIALGTLAEVNVALDAGEDAEEKDRWERTPLLLAIQTGDQHKVELLLLHGVERNARGRCGKPAVFYAIEMRNVAMLSWLVEQGFSLLDTDEFGTSALACACESGCFEAVRALLDAGHDPDQHQGHLNALYCCREATTARALLDAGADPNNLQFEIRRALVGLPAEPCFRQLNVTSEAFWHGAQRRFGTSNPERMDDPFWMAMVRSGISAWMARTHFSDNPSSIEHPVWCAQRFGQSISFLPDGRIIQIAGEHEDGYDPDFCIYNDVFVHYPDGRIEIYGYPEEVFPPTDFHTATLVGDTIYLIGSLGFRHQRVPGVTQVFALDTRTLRITRLETSGDSPGSIYRHRAVLTPTGRIRIFGGRIEHGDDVQSDNDAMFELDLARWVWIRLRDE